MKPTKEHDLLRAISAGDADARSVYADWLEGNGRPVHAEFLRLTDVKPANTRDALDADTYRLRELAPEVEPIWRMQVSRPIIEGCTNTECPGEWGALREGGLANVRMCGTCRRVVHYCLEETELLDHAMRGDFVAADVTFDRLNTVCGRCGRINQRVYRFCLGCGAETVVMPAVRPTAAPVACRSCGQQNPAAFRFCQTCGERLKA